MSGRRFEKAGFKGMMRVWNGRAQGNDAGVEEQGSREWQGSTSWRRCRGAGFRGMAGLNRMMRGRVLAERTGAVRGGKRRGSRTGAVRGDARGHWAYVLRASLKVQSSFDIWDFVGFIPLAQRQLGR